VNTVAVPEKIKIEFVPRSPTNRIGTHGSAEGRDQFFGCVVATLAEPGGSDWRSGKRWYAILHRFDADGRHVGTDHFFAGTTADGEAAVVASAEEKLKEWLGRLVSPSYEDVWIRRFSVTIDGSVFGLVDGSDPEGDEESILLLPNDLVFFPPWDGSYDT
jgi:formate hydrogenlyase regulatory protein HycA